MDGFKEHVKLMVEINCFNGIIIKGVIPVIYSYYRAEHAKTDKGRANMLSFNNQIFSKSTVESVISSRVSFNIF